MNGDGDEYTVIESSLSIVEYESFKSSHNLSCRFTKESKGDGSIYDRLECKNRRKFPDCPVLYKAER